MSDITKDVVWLRRLLNELGAVQQRPTQVRVDNQAAIKLSKNPEFHFKSKHIDTRYHFAREQQEKGMIVFEFIRTQEQPADMLTKGLPAGPHLSCMQRLLMA